VAPIKGHDIPGVRSFEQLKLAYHYHPEEYEFFLIKNLKFQFLF